MWLNVCYFRALFVTPHPKPHVQEPCSTKEVASSVYFKVYFLCRAANGLSTEVKPVEVIETQSKDIYSIWSSLCGWFVNRGYTSSDCDSNRRPTRARVWFAYSASRAICERYQQLRTGKHYYLYGQGKYNSTATHFNKVGGCAEICKQ